MINIALAGNPNVGKSTVFNALTGLHQHTGNWAGKTVETARGTFVHDGVEYTLTDIPGTYSLMSSSVEEQVARDYICFGDASLSVVVVDATCLERNLVLVLQILEVTRKAVVCVNLMDEAKKKHICVDANELSRQLGVAVVGVCARSGKGLNELKSLVAQGADAMEDSAEPIFYGQVIERAVELLMPWVSKAVEGRLDARWVCLRLIDGDAQLNAAISQYLGFELCDVPEISQALVRAREILQDAGMGSQAVRDRITSAIMERASRIANACTQCRRADAHSRDRRLDRIFTSRITGIPVMLAMLAVVFWLTVQGANYPSQLLSRMFNFLEPRLDALIELVGIPDWIRLALVQGSFRTLGWVVSVMLPPMAIFFPLFTLLEDSGYLPRVAFNLDGFFSRCGAHGKQALTTCMGFGCNACGIMGCRIIDSPRERLIAVLTNNFAPCNGRFPTLIAVIGMFLATGALGAVKSVGLLMAVILLGLGMTFVCAKLLSATLLKGQSSSFALELPPYRVPQMGKVIVRSVLDRTLFVLGRAAAVAAPAGLVIWFVANVNIGGASILAHVTGFLDPIARLIGLDGVILTAFILGLPANEIVFPIMIMTYISGGNLVEMGDLTALHALLTQNGWTWVTAVCTLVFCLCHFPCATALWTVKKETGSVRWMLAAAVIPTLVGAILCFLINTAAALL